MELFFLLYLLTSLFQEYSLRKKMTNIFYCISFTTFMVKYIIAILPMLLPYLWSFENPYYFLFCFVRYFKPVCHVSVVFISVNSALVTQMWLFSLSNVCYSHLFVNYMNSLPCFFLISHLYAFIIYIIPASSFRRPSCLQFIWENKVICLT